MRQYRLNNENKMVMDEMWPAEKPSRPDHECKYCGKVWYEEEYDTLIECCLMCYADAKGALDKCLKDGTQMTKTQREIIAEWLTTV